MSEVHRQCQTEDMEASVLEDSLALRCCTCHAAYAHVQNGIGYLRQTLAYRPALDRAGVAGRICGALEGIAPRRIIPMQKLAATRMSSGIYEA